MEEKKKKNPDANSSYFESMYDGDNDNPKLH